MYTAIDIIQGMKRNWGPEQFTQNRFAANMNGFTTDWQRWNQDGPGQAVAFCTAGAANVEADKLGLIDRGACGTPSFPVAVQEALGLIQAEIATRTRTEKGTYLGIAGFNDTHGYAAVMDVLDAILTRHGKALNLKAEARRQDVMDYDLVLAGV